MFRSAGGRLQRMASGVGRSQAGFAIWGPDPVKEISQTCGLKRHCKARKGTLDRRMVTAAKHVYSTWQLENDRSLKIYRPASSVVVFLATPVASFAMVTVAPGI